MASDDDDFDDLDVVIVGAGVSGLTAAYQLWKKDQSLRVVLLEAKDRVGGRTVGEELKGAEGPEKWDLGGQWVGNCQPHIMALLKELSLDTYEEYTTGLKVNQVMGTRVKTYRGDIPALPWYALIDLHLFINKAERMMKDIDIRDPGSYAQADVLDGMTVEDVKQKMLWTKAARNAVDCSNRCIFGQESSQMSALYYLIYGTAAGGLEPIISTKKHIGGQELKVKGGAWQVCHRLKNKIGADKIHLNTPVHSITQTEEEVVVRTATGREYHCQRVILALPPHQSAKLIFNPSLPCEKLHVFHRMPPGNITKIIVTYSTSFWRRCGFSGEAVTSGGTSVIPGIDRGPLCIVFDATSANGSPAIVTFIGGDQHIQYSVLKPADRKRAVIYSLSEMFGQEALDPLDYREKNWSEEPYNHGGPVSIATPGTGRYFAPALRLPFGRLHFAGTESATVWCGFINGAVQTGYRAANEVLYNLRPQAISATDLEGTAYDKPRRKPCPNSSIASKMLRWSVCLGTVALTAVVVKKYFPDKMPKLKYF